jgi:hypothetical protein
MPWPWVNRHPHWYHGRNHCCAGISFTQIHPSGACKVYYLSYSLFSKSIYLNQVHTEGYNNLKKYIHFITLDISQKYPHLKLGILSNLGKSIRVTLT